MSSDNPVDLLSGQSGTPLPRLARAEERRRRARSFLDEAMPELSLPKNSERALAKRSLKAAAIRCEPEKRCYASKCPAW
jgi:hypothetical protein